MTAVLHVFKKVRAGGGREGVTKGRTEEKEKQAPPTTMKPMGVRSAFAREIVLLGAAALMCATSIVCMVLSLSSNEWLRVSSQKAPFPGAPWLSFDLGLTGGVATMHQQWTPKRESWSSVGFKYADSSKYCPDGQCEALYYAGIVAIVLMSLAVGACFAAMIIEVTVMVSPPKPSTLSTLALSLTHASFLLPPLSLLPQLQLGNVFVERGPFGPYVNYQRCWRNCVAASVSSSLGFAFSVAASASWGGIMYDHQANMPGGLLGAGAGGGASADAASTSLALPGNWPIPDFSGGGGSKWWPIPDFSGGGAGGGGHTWPIPDFHGGGGASSHIEWHLGWVWALNIIVPLLMIGATSVVSYTAKMSSHPFTGYSSIL